MHRARSRRRRRRLVLALIVLALLVWWWRRTPPLVLGTFNIRTFPDKDTKLDAVAAAIAELDADAFAVQEIGAPDKLDEALAAANGLTGRRYVARLFPYCWKMQDSPYDRLFIGVVYDADRLDLERALPLSKGENCPQGQAPAALALLRPHGGPPVALVSVHLAALPKKFTQRKQQWRWLLRELPRLTRKHGAPVVLAGDFNSTGYLGEPAEERGMIDDLVAAHDLMLPTATIGCSEYWQRNKKGPFMPSLLDHVVLPADLGDAQAEVLGMCAALACAPQDVAPDGYHTVSDHCPVRVVVRR